MQNLSNNKQHADMPLVSFIITYYNLSVGMLCECIDSIMALSLSRAEREIIIVDDGSDLCVMNELDRYADSIIYVRQRNGGLSDARNMGIRVASGKYIQFVDGDDKLNRAPYEHCLDTVRYRNPDMVMFNFSTDNDQTAYYNMSEPVTGTEFMSHNNIHATACGYVFKASILGSLRFTRGIYHEDEEFTPQLLLRAETVCHTNAKAYMYRRRTGSITSSGTHRAIVKRLTDKLNVIYRLNELGKTLPTNDRIAMQRRTAQLTMDYIYNVIVQTRSRKFLDKKLAELYSRGLFPLPDRNYTTKYKWFRRMTMSGVGLTLLINTLPLIKRER